MACQELYHSDDDCGKQLGAETVMSWTVIINEEKMLPPIQYFFFGAGNSVIKMRVTLHLPK